MDFYYDFCNIAGKFIHKTCWNYYYYFFFNFLFVGIMHNDFMTGDYVRNERKKMILLEFFSFFLLFSSLPPRNLISGAQFWSMIPVLPCFSFFLQWKWDANSCLCRFDFNVASVVVRGTTMVYGKKIELVLGESRNFLEQLGSSKNAKKSMGKKSTENGGGPSPWLSVLIVSCTEGIWI